MNVPISAVMVVVVIFGFLTGSSLYFYNKIDKGEKSTNSQTFSADIPESGSSLQPSKVDELTKPADVKGRVTYPANVYEIQKGDSLFGIGAKFEIDWELILLANSLESENVVQVGKQLVIPKLSHETDYFRINFLLDDDNASEKNRELREVEQDSSYNPILAAKDLAVPYFGITETDEFTLLEQDNSTATAIVQVKNGEKINVVGMFQPKQKGEKGFWAILYIEHHE